jgi:hypothetical protein
MSLDLIEGIARTLRAGGARPHSRTRPAWARRLRAFELLEARQLLSAVALADFSVAQSSGEKPQSKTWEHAGFWWSVMPDRTGTWVWRLDGSSWTQALRLSTNVNAKADVKASGDLTHILLVNGGSTQLASIEYVGAGSYAPWTLRPGLVSIPLSSNETATLDVDSTGRMWVGADSGSTIQVRYSDGVYANWSTPITIASGISSDDISVITAMPDHSIGVLWSNQNTKRFGFRTHHDGDAPGAWSADELPASQSALNIGGGMADDHMNVAVASDGTLYAAVKTSYDSGGQTKIALLVRRPNGAWDNLYNVDTSGTRPIVLLNEAAGRLIVAYAASEGKANIVYRETSTAAIVFGPRQTLISGSVQDVSSSKQNFTSDVALLASTGSTAKSVLFSFDEVIVNQPPVVDAGPARTASIDASVALDGSVIDDGKPGPISASWLKVSGPGAVTFVNAAAIDATATFSAAGSYVLRLSATDGQFTSFDDVTIVVESTAPPATGAAVTVAFQDGVYPLGGYSGARDAKIRSGNKNTNYGDSATLEVDGSPGAASLLGWDLRAIPEGSTVLSAAIELYVTNQSWHDYDILALDRAWQEYGATWNSTGAGDAWSAPGAGGPADRGGASLGVIAARTIGPIVTAFNAAGLAAVQQWVDDPGANHGVVVQNYIASDGMDFRSRETGVAAQRPKLVVTYLPPGEPPVDPVNASPTVNAGADQTIAWGAAALLSGAANDDGLQAPLTTQWTKVSGPGDVTFSAANLASATAAFSAPGTYVLKLSAFDGELSASDNVSITVLPAAPLNKPPQVNAGPDQTAIAGAPVALNGSAADDGLPGPLAVAWSQASGPGSVAFNNAGAATTTATFSMAGTYVLRLSATDGQLAAQDEVTITVSAPQNAGGLAGHWSLDSVAGGATADSSGQGNWGTLVGAPQAIAGMTDGALLFNGANRVVVNDAAVLNPANQITLSAWIRPSATGTQYIVKKGRQSEVDGYELSLSSTGKVFVRFNQRSSGDAFRVDSASTIPVNGAWTHVAATYDGSTLRLYINGVLQASKNASFQIAASSLPLSIGAEDDGYRGYRGAVDDVRIYNRALGASEIAALVNP